MRRSSAPSRSSPNFNNHTVVLANAVSETGRSPSALLSLLNKPFLKESNEKPEITVLKNASNKRKLLSDNSENIEASQNVSIENIERTENNHESKCIFYNVVWGKQTKKKHKTWEGDGILEVTKSHAILKDTEGTILGRSSKLKSPLEEGSMFYVGAKEVQIIDIIPEHLQKKTVRVEKENSSNQCDASHQTTAQNKKFASVSKKSKNFMSPTLSTKDTDCSLKMPDPDSTHQVIGGFFSLDEE